MTNIEMAPGAQHVLNIALNYALRKLGLLDRNDPVCANIAKHMVDLHQRGVTDAVALAEIAIREIRAD